MISAQQQELLSAIYHHCRYVSLFCTGIDGKARLKILLVVIINWQQKKRALEELLELLQEELQGSLSMPVSVKHQNAPAGVSMQAR
ncbi:MAG: hypothetical protein IT342_17080 [Candidatus Melainabacteria bacterium]|nr:hypothetical protein [Candidatus Melainabacteria bacterium]